MKTKLLFAGLLAGTVLLAAAVPPAVTHLHKKRTEPCVGVRHIEFPAEDLGKEVNAAIAALPANGGDVIISAGSYTFPTRIDFRDRNCIRLMGQGGISYDSDFPSATNLTYTGTGAAIKIGTGNSKKRTYGNQLHNFKLRTYRSATGILLDDSHTGKMSNLALLGYPPWLIRQVATGGSHTTLLDSKADFVAKGVKPGMKLVLLQGPGFSQVAEITGVTVDTLTFDTLPVAPAAGTKYAAGAGIGIDVKGNCYSWDLEKVQTNYYTIGANLDHAHAWTLIGHCVMYSDIGIRIRETGNLAMLSGEIDWPRTSGVDVISGTAIDLHSVYCEAGRVGEDGYAIRIGNQDGRPRVVNIRGWRFQRAGQTKQQILLTRVLTANITGNYFVLNRPGSAIMNCPDSEWSIRDVLLMGNYLAAPSGSELISNMENVTVFP